MKLTRAQRDILWSDFRADDSGRAPCPTYRQDYSLIDGHSALPTGHRPLPAPLLLRECELTRSKTHSYMDKCTPISEARARKLDPALVAYMEQPE